MEKRNQPEGALFFRFIIPPFIAAVFFFSHVSLARTIDLSWAAQKKKTVVSGTLNPGSLSVNGQEVTQSQESFKDLLVNGTSAKITEVSGLQTFYEVVEGDQMNLQWLTAGGEKKDILTVSYPSVKEMIFKDNLLILRFNELTRKVRYDGQEIQLSDPTVIPVTDTETWVSEPHTLELSTDKNVSLIYNLDFKSIRTAMLTHRSWIVYSGDPPFSANVRPPLYAAGARILDEKNFSREVVVGGAKTTYGLGPQPTASEATQQVVLVEFRYGYNPFKTNLGTIDVKRVSLGLQGALVYYERESTFPTYMDGYSETHIKTVFNQGGFFVRWEPLQYKDFGFLLHLNQRVFRSQDNIQSDSTTHYFGLAYYF